METKTCQNCKQNFVIEPEDFDFYEKIKVPPPTWCPDCRLQRRLMWRNERTLYRRKCDAPGHSEDIISIYPQEVPFKVYDHEFWYGDGWDALKYGRDYDFTKPFFQQYRELLEATPAVALFDSKSVNSSYCNVTVEHKNCYLVTAGWGNEDSMYSNRISYCKDTLDSYAGHKTEFSYENVYCKDSYQLFFSRNSESCNNSYFLYDCRGCSDCVCSTNLRNKQYYIFNKPYSKEDYFKKLEELNLKNRDGLKKLAAIFDEMYLKSVHRYAHLINTINVVGDNVEDSRNCYYCFDLAGNAEDSKYCHWGTYGLRDSYDTGAGTGGNSELIYEGISIGVTNSRCYFGAIVWYSHDVQYGFNCQDSSNLFGCVGLRKKEYCILNKQYTKEEYERLLPKIIDHMNKMPYTDAKGRKYAYGEYFPGELSPWAYNEAIVQDYITLDKKTAESQGYRWRDAEEKDPVITIPASDIPQAIKDVSDDILEKTLGCVHAGGCNDQCSKAFRITSQELEFYRRLNLPLPDLCPNCRHYRRLKQRNPLKLWHRKCQCAGAANQNQIYKNTAEHAHKETHCPNEFETSYAPDRPEIVYCEQCYQNEVA